MYSLVIYRWRLLRCRLLTPSYRNLFFVILSFLGPSIWFAFTAIRAAFVAYFFFLSFRSRAVSRTSGFRNSTWANSDKVNDGFPCLDARARKAFGQILRPPVTIHPLVEGAELFTSSSEDGDTRLEEEDAYDDEEDDAGTP